MVIVSLFFRTLGGKYHWYGIATRHTQNISLDLVGLRKTPKKALSRLKLYYRRYGDFNILLHVSLTSTGLFSLVAESVPLHFRQMPVILALFKDTLQRKKFMKNVEELLVVNCIVLAAHVC